MGINYPQFSMEKLTLYQALYCPFTEESDYGVISTHFSRKGAEKAIKEHKETVKQKHDKHYNWMIENNALIDSYDYSYDKWMAWDIREIEVLP